VNLSIELNKDRNHNLHLFAGKLEDDKPDKESENTLVIQGGMERLNSFGNEVVKKLASMPKGRTLYIEPGIHYIRESTMKLPSDTNVYLAGGCIIIGAFVCSGVENVRIYGRGIVYQADFQRYGGTNGIRLSNAWNIFIRGLTVWADVAHPLNIGTHGDYENNGDIIENIQFEDIDILEHNEYQAGYLGCMAINVGDKNTARNIRYKDIRIEPIKHGKLLDIQVKCNTDYNPAPGKRIENIQFEEIRYTGSGEVTSEIKGFNPEYIVNEVGLHNILINGKKVNSLKDANIEVGEFAYNIAID